MKIISKSYRQRLLLLIGRRESEKCTNIVVIGKKASIIFAMTFGLVLWGLFASAQKPEISVDILDTLHWEMAPIPAISNDGRFTCYQWHAGGKLDHPAIFLQDHHKNKKQSFAGHDPRFDENSHWLIFVQNDSVYVKNLYTSKSAFILKSPSFQLVEKGKDESIITGMSGTTLVIQSLSRAKIIRFPRVTNYLVSKNGTTFVFISKESNGRQQLSLFDYASGNLTNIAEADAINSPVVSDDGKALAFLKAGENGKLELFNYRTGQPAPHLVEMSNDVKGKPYKISAIKNFSGNEDNLLFFTIQETLPPAPVRDSLTRVDVWSYTDPVLQSEQLLNLKQMQQRDYLMVYNASARKTLRVEEDNETAGNMQDHFIIITQSGPGDVVNEWNWNKTAFRSAWLMNLENGERKCLDPTPAVDHGIGYELSPDARYIFYFNPLHHNYFSYDIQNGTTTNLTENIHETWTYPLTNYGQDPTSNYGAMSRLVWIKGTDKIVLTSLNGLWVIDLSQRSAAVHLPLLGNQPAITYEIWPKTNFDIKAADSKLLLHVIDHDAVKESVYRLSLFPYKLSKLMEQQAYLSVVKAKNADCYIVTEESAACAPDNFFTSDFKTYNQLTNIHPERNWNWFTTEVKYYTTYFGVKCRGVLFKPENFDPRKKYPLVFYYYEDEAEGAQKGFRRPDFTAGPINIPYFVSNGYLVFVPDIPKKVGYAGESAYSSVMAAADMLVKSPYVDSLRMAIQGQSFGGFETEYLVTHTHRFAAACPTSGMSDFISCYGSLVKGDASPRARQYEINHDAMGGNLWNIQSRYIANAPVLKADQVETPVLMMSNRNDDDVPFAQGVEFFTALRRLGKRAWMLQYDDGNHEVFDKHHLAKDLTIRIKQFFDHYLMDKSAPIWMTKGIPATEKGVRNGYEFDATIKTPGPGLLLDSTKVGTALIKPN